MARIALSWGIRDLAAKAGVGQVTVSRFERGEPIRADTLDKLRTTFEREGLSFVDEDENGGPGVRLAPAKPKRRSRKTG
jgi:transcriptional regulator with XRE-family HTH domain